MARRLFFAGVLLLCGVIASCSDATAPTGSFLVVVSPDTVHVGQGGVQPFITFRERFVSVAQNKVWVPSPDLETELTPGKWQLLINPDNLYLQAALGNATAPTNSDLGAARTLYISLAPGRYRMRQRYQVTTSNATQPAGEVFVATSNVFVVVSP